MNEPIDMQKRSSELCAEADLVLGEKGLLAILSEFGTAHVSGSYALDLMTWRDLDIYLESADLPERRFFELGGRIASAFMPSRMQFRNERIAKTQGLPVGLYWGIYFNLTADQAWKIDIWCVPSEVCRRLLRHCGSIAARLTPDTRNAVLQIKTACWAHPEYRRGFSSQDIYSAVLDDGIATLDQFREYLQTKKGIGV